MECVKTKIYERERERGRERERERERGVYDTFIRLISLRYLCLTHHSGGR